MSIFKTITNLFKCSKLSSTQLDYSDLLPRRFVSVNKPIYILAMESSDFGFVDSYMIKMVNSKLASNEDQFEIMLFEPISPDGSKSVMEWIRQSFESPPEKEVLRKVRIKQLDQVGTTINTINLNNCRIVSADFGDPVKYISEDTNIILTLVSKNFI